MPTARPLVNVEALLVAYLDADPLVDGHVATDAPKQGEAGLQVFRASGTPADAGTGHVDRALIQVNAYGVSKSAAWSLFAQSHRALLDAADADHAAGVVTGVDRLTGPTWSPDPVTSAPRYTGSYAVTAHPSAS